MSKKTKYATAPFGIGKKKAKSEEHEEEREAAAQAAARAAAEEAERLRLEKQKALEAEETKRRKGARYGKRGLPMEEYLGESQSGYRRTVLGG